MRSTVKKSVGILFTVILQLAGEELAFNRWYPRSESHWWTRNPHTAGPSWRCRADRILWSRSAGCKSSGPISCASVRRRRRCSRESLEAVGGAPRRAPYSRHSCICDAWGGDKLNMKLFDCTWTLSKRKSYSYTRILYSSVVHKHLSQGPKVGPSSSLKGPIGIGPSV